VLHPLKEEIRDRLGSGKATYLSPKKREVVGGGREPGGRLYKRGNERVQTSKEDLLDRRRKGGVPVDVKRSIGRERRAPTQQGG